MKRIAEIAAAVVVVLSLSGVSAGQSPSVEFERRAREMKARHQRRAAEMKTRHKRRVAEMKADSARGISNSGPRPLQTGEVWARHKRRAAEMKADLARRGKRSPIPFDASSAPSPTDCLKAYIAAAAKAQTFQDLHKYLPRHRQVGTRNRGSNNVDQYARFQITRHKRIAAKILDVLSVKIDGNKALLTVSTNSGGISNGVEFPYGKAKIKMLGEYGFWTIDSYNDSPVKYKQRPQPKG